MASRDIAKALHTTQESLAPKYGYSGTTVAWGDLPDEDKNLMIATVDRLTENGVIRPGNAGVRKRIINRLPLPRGPIYLHTLNDHCISPEKHRIVTNSKKWNEIKNLGQLRQAFTHFRCLDEFDRISVVQALIHAEATAIVNLLDESFSNIQPFEMIWLDLNADWIFYTILAEMKRVGAVENFLKACDSTRQWNLANKVEKELRHV